MRHRGTFCVRVVCVWLTFGVLVQVTACGSARYTARPAEAASSTAAQTPEKTIPPATPVRLTPAPSPSLAPIATPTVPIAASVNGQTITVADFERLVKRYQQALLDQGLDPATQQGQADLAGIRRDVLESMIDSVLVEQAARELRVTLSDRNVEAQVAADIAGGGGQGAFDEWLASTGQTPKDYQEAVRQALLSERVMEAVTADVPGAVEQVHLRHIVVDSRDAAEAILAQLRQGADFAALAGKDSVDAGTKEKGGDLGWLPRGLLPSELESVAFALQAGEISDAVAVGGRYEILQVVERDKARALTPEVRSQLQSAMFDRWLEARRAAAKIERFVGE